MWKKKNKNKVEFIKKVSFYLIILEYENSNEIQIIIDNNESLENNQNFNKNNRTIKKSSIVFLILLVVWIVLFIYTSFKKKKIRNEIS